MEPLIIFGAWALISLSLFNGLVLLWLGLTMFLAAEERQFGLWLILLGMVMAGLFFLSHTAILADQLTPVGGVSVNGWWKVGWLPVIVAPLLWYMLMLWYAGFWEKDNHALRWHRYPLAILIAISALLLGFHIFAHAVPSFDQIAVLDFSETLRISGIPVMLILFPAYMIVCVLLPIHAIQHPSPPRYEISSLARQRARPWLIRTSALLLVVSVIVAGFIGYVILEAQNAQHGSFGYAIFTLPLIAFDLGVTGMIAAAIISLGQAVTAYEIFTGKTLPRRGFARQWYVATGIAAVVSAFIGYNLIFYTYFIYAIFILAGIVMIVYALLSWRTFIYRDQIIANLHPFVSSQSLIQNMIDPEQDTLPPVQRLFESMCEQILGITRAQITPDKALSLLISAPLVYPIDAEPANVTLPDGNTIQQLNPHYHAGFHWAIPLWSVRGRIGVMLLGEKAGGGLYSEEEMQVAQTAGERLLDMFAGEVMVQQLVRLQRKRITEQRVMDFQTRRTLHDRSLPALHEAILALSSTPDQTVREIVNSLSGIHKEISNLIHTTPIFPTTEPERDFISVLRGSIQNEFGGEFEHIHWQIPENPTVIDSLTADILYGVIREVVRNAAVHGRGDNPKRSLGLWIAIRNEDALNITIHDDGIGLSSDRQHSSGGSGLVLHGTLMALIGGSLSTEVAEQGGTTVHISK